MRASDMLAQLNCIQAELDTRGEAVTGAYLQTVIDRVYQMKVEEEYIDDLVQERKQPFESTL